jgi:hypothetical protein
MAMKRLGALACASVLALLFVGVIVLAGGDTTIFVSPPEAVAEEFTRKLAEGRYDMALEHLEQGGPEMRRTVRRSGERLRAQTGGINQIEGASSAITRETATAMVTIAADAANVRWSFDFVRQQGEWKIRDWR